MPFTVTNILSIKMKTLDVYKRQKHISKTFGDRQVLVDVNLQVKQGDVVVILGPSG